MNTLSTLSRAFSSLTPTQKTAVVATGCVVTVATGGAVAYALATAPALAVSVGTTSLEVLTGAAAVAYASR